MLTQKHEDQGSPNHDHCLQSICIDHGREAPWGPKERAHQSVPTAVPLWVPTLCVATLGRPEKTRGLFVGGLQPPAFPWTASPWRVETSQSQAELLTLTASACGCPGHSCLSLFTIPSLFFCVSLATRCHPSLPRPECPFKSPSFPGRLSCWKSTLSLSQAVQVCARCSGGARGRRVCGFCLEQSTATLVQAAVP